MPSDLIRGWVPVFRNDPAQLKPRGPGPPVEARAPRVRHCGGDFGAMISNAKWPVSKNRTFGVGNVALERFGAHRSAGTKNIASPDGPKRGRRVRRTRPWWRIGCGGHSPHPTAPPPN